MIASPTRSFVPSGQCDSSVLGITSIARKVCATVRAR